MPLPYPRANARASVTPSALKITAVVIYGPLEVRNGCAHPQGYDTFDQSRLYSLQRSFNACRLVILCSCDSHGWRMPSIQLVQYHRQGCRFDGHFGRTRNVVGLPFLIALYDNVSVAEDACECLFSIGHFVTP